MTHAYLGIDVGGTASRWVAIDAAGTEIARGRAGGATGHLFNPTERSRFVAVIEEIATQCPVSVERVCIGLTGYGERVADDVRVALAGRFGIGAADVIACDDLQLAYFAVFDPGEGHVVSAGTGSIGLHLTTSGEVLRVGGRGLLIDDAGSGTWIALTALDRLYRIIDETGGPGRAGRLAEALHVAVGGSDWDDVRGFVYGSDRGRIGTLARPVADAATAGDPLALEILQQAAVELARLAQALIARTAPLPIAFIGGIIDLQPCIREGLAAALAGMDLRFPRIDAALRGAEAALRAEHLVQVRSGGK